jgi:hypothetical protein
MTKIISKSNNLFGHCHYKGEFSNSKIEHRCPKNTKVFCTNSENPHRKLCYFWGNDPGEKNIEIWYIPLYYTYLIEYK